MSVQGLNAKQAEDNSDNIAQLIASRLNVEKSRVVILGLFEARRRRRLTLTTALLHGTMEALGLGDSRRRLTGLSIRFQVTGYVDTASAGFASADLQAYVVQTDGAGFIAELNAADSALGLATNAAQVTEDSVTDISLANTLASYSFTCPLSAKDQLYWSVSDDESYVQVLMLHTDDKDDWVALGVVDEDEQSMVGDADKPVRVFLYRPTVTSTNFYYQIDGYMSTNFDPADDATRDTTHHRVDSVQSIDNYVVLRAEFAKEPGAEGDTRLQLGEGKNNRLIWATGGTWPTQHSSAGRGFATVSWVDGVCEETDGGGKAGAGMKPVVTMLCLVALVVLFNGKVSPFRSQSASCASVPLLSREQRLSPTVLSRFIGDYAASWLAFGFDERRAAFYSVPGALFFALYYALNIAVLLTNMGTGDLKAFTLATGYVAVMNMWVSLLPSSKSSLVMHLTGVPFERCIKFHKIATYAGFMASVLHGTCAFLLMDSRGVAPLDVPFGQEAFGHVNPGLGLLALAFYCLMFLMAFDFVRRAKYEVFLVIHQFWLVAVICNMLHFKPGEMFQLGFLPGLCLQLLDKASLWMIPTRAAKTQVVCANGSSKVDAVELCVTMSDGNPSSMGAVNIWHRIAQFTTGKGTNIADYTHNGFSSGGDPEFDSFYALGHFYFVQVPAISTFEWHPFSVSEVVEGGAGAAALSQLKFHIQPLGEHTWTGELAKAALSTAKELPVRLRGPYGSLFLNIAAYKHLVIMAGGIGITPFLPVLDRVRYWLEHENKAAKFPHLQSVTVVWAVREDKASLLEHFARRIQTQPRHTTSATANLVDESGVASARTDYRKVGVDSVSEPVQWTSRFFMTGGKKGGKNAKVNVQNVQGVKTVCETGRPDLQAILRNVPSPSSGSGSHVCAMICGPSSMTIAATKVCADEGVPVHLETFGW